ncbi:hypothetical protein [Sorangium sp. So ce693]|uniref:hypothetical protein n=1 Tax=Sorangium sp. So ce693 TaxID=3133318 RepID=UPI003F613F50
MCAFAELLGPDFEVDRDVLRDALTRRSCASIFYLPMVTKIDIFALGPSPCDEVEFSRRRKVKVRASGEELVVKAPEEIILRKHEGFPDSEGTFLHPTVRATYSSKRPVASRSRSYRLVSGNGGNQDSRRTIQLS